MPPFQCESQRLAGLIGAVAKITLVLLGEIISRNDTDDGSRKR